MTAILFKSNLAGRERAWCLAKALERSGICNKHECAPFLATLKGPLNKRRNALKKNQKYIE